jgi:DNA-binding transcriptional LysR family regulator
MRRKIPATHTLLCFEAAARHQSYTRAAQELALTQSAVSRQVAALEEYLGQALFQRTRHGVSLTPRGQEYARQVTERLLALERDTLNAMSTQGTQGAVHMAAVPTFATRWLIPRLPELRALHPDIVVHIETRTRPFLFADTPFDAALYAGTAEQVANWAGTRSTLLVHEEVLPVCAPRLLGQAQRLSPQAVAELPLLQQSTRPFGWSQWFEAMGVAAPNALSGPRLTKRSEYFDTGVPACPPLTIPMFVLAAWALLNTPKRLLMHNHGSLAPRRCWRPNAASTALMPRAPQACPTSIDVPSFIRRIAEDNLRGAARTILESNPLGGMCARVCPTENLCEPCVCATQEDAGGHRPPAAPCGGRADGKRQTANLQPRAPLPAKKWPWWAPGRPVWPVPTLARKGT